MGADRGVAEPFDDRHRFLGEAEFAGQLGLCHQSSRQPDGCAETAAGRNGRRKERGALRVTEDTGRAADGERDRCVGVRTARRDQVSERQEQFDHDCRLLGGVQGRGDFTEDAQRGPPDDVARDRGEVGGGLRRQESARVIEQTGLHVALGQRSAEPRDVRVLGHALFHGGDEFVQPSLHVAQDEELRRVEHERIRLARLGADLECARAETLRLFDLTGDQRAPRLVHQRDPLLVRLAHLIGEFDLLGEGAIHFVDVTDLDGHREAIAHRGPAGTDVVECFGDSHVLQRVNVSFRRGVRNPQRVAARGEHPRERTGILEFACDGQRFVGEFATAVIVLGECEFGGEDGEQLRSGAAAFGADRH